MNTIFKISKKIMVILIGIILLLVAVVFLYMRQAKFGKKPEGERLDLMQKSAHYKDGKFQNINHTPDLTEGYTMMGIIYDQLFKDHPRRKPKQKIPSVKTNLKNIPLDTNILVWFGHSSYFIQVDGLRFLVDPVFSGNASPIPGSVKAYPGSNTYGVDDMPEIDYVLISHDHYDHLDYKTIIALKPKVKKVICGLGVGAHFEHWDYLPEQVIEKDWHEEISLKPGYSIFTTPTRHFSGRGFTRNNTVWQSYVLQTPSLKIYIGGDSGYDTHFADIGNTHGPFDLVILENGQYNVAWEAIHLMPDKVLKAAEDLKAKRLFPVHSSKFTLAMHPWDEPLKEVSRINDELYKYPLVTPIIGEVVDLNNADQPFKRWWEEIE